MSEVIIDATWKLPEGHESVEAFDSLDEAKIGGAWIAQREPEWTYYLMDKRGAWELIRYPRK